MHPISRPCISHPTKSAPPPTAISWGPRVCGPHSPIDEWARSGPRRRATIWGTWPPNLSSPYCPRLLVEQVELEIGLGMDQAREADADQAHRARLHVRLLQGGPGGPKDRVRVVRRAGPA